MKYVQSPSTAPMPAPNLADIRAAHARVAPRIHRTPLLSATRLGARAGVTLYHKCESLQKTGSFKVRGALNNVSQLDAAARKRGVITVSAGNHAQALAWARSEERRVGKECRSRGGGCDE